MSRVIYVFVLFVAVAQACDLIERKEIGFHARLTAAPAFSRNEIIKFPAVDTNEGNGYNATSGKFTAPEAGTYYFSVMVTVKTGKYTTWYIKSSKDKVYAKVLAVGIQSSGSATGSAIIKLAKGEKVFVWHQYSSGNNADVRCDIHTCPTFSGFVIN